MKKRLTFILLMVLATITCKAQNERRLALVIGNAEYVGKGNTLRNPVNDASDVSNKLKTLGFDVTTVLNASMLEMDDAIDAFGQKAKNYDVALFYYSGHGLQSKGDNYMMPVDAELRSEADVRYKCTPLNLLLAKLEESECPMKLVVLDACRDNPFERSWHKGMGTKGLSVVNAPKGTLISYATSPGRTAEDGIGRNSPYTTAFLESLDIPNLSLSDFFDNVGTLVLEKTNDEQTPWIAKSPFRGSFYFNKTTVTAVAQTPTQTQRPTQTFEQVTNNPTSTKKTDTMLEQTITSSTATQTATTTSPNQPLETPSESLTFTVNGVSFVMKRVEGGIFWMGAQNIDPKGQNYDSESNDNESPVHSVTLSNYYIGETEVTQALWKAVTGKNPSKFIGDNLPVENVNWDDCHEFILKLNQLTGKNFRLPTEAEWEYAARGGKIGNDFSYASRDNIDNVCWYWRNSGDKPIKGKYTADKVNKYNCRTHPVKTKLPNGLGIFDMYGNVIEWCQDFYGEYNSIAQHDPQGPSSPSHPSHPRIWWERVMRGTSYRMEEKSARPTLRMSQQTHGWASEQIGLRLSLSE